jgi:hypothetical protein
MNQGRWWAAGWLLAWSMGASAYGGPVDATPRSPAQLLTCLQVPTQPMKYPEQFRYDHGTGFMRVKLSFEAPDAKPRVEVLSNTAREDMQDLVYQRLAKYRLPCLTPEDGVVSAVQEFSFTNTDREPLPLPPDEKDAASVCIVMPREGASDGRLESREVENVVVAVTFYGDSQEPSNAKVIYSTGSTALERAALEYVAKYRMPCRTAGDKPFVFRQTFGYRPPGNRTYVFKREGFGLMEFLAMTEGARELEADFDTRTMNCPFKVNYTAYGPHLPNEVYSGDSRRDANRAIFLEWLSKRQLAFTNDKQRRELWGSQLQINVPCGRLSLHPKAAAADAPASSAGG